MKSDQLFSDDQCISPSQQFCTTEINSDQNFLSVIFLLNKNQITEILKKLPDLLYHNLVEWRWVGRVVFSNLVYLVKGNFQLVQDIVTFFQTNKFI